MRAWRDYPAEPRTQLASRYTVLKLIGEGSYGLIYLCEDAISGDFVAVKQARCSKGRFARQLLDRETHILKSLKHTQFPAYLNHFTEKLHSYLVMSYLSGDTLEDLIFEQGKTYNERQCLSVTIQLLELVVPLHQQGWVHLDLRIPNVLFQKNKLYLIDFGLARRIGEAPCPSSSAEDHKPPEEQSDLEDIGHFMLFMLYSSFTPDVNTAADGTASWQEELNLSLKIKHIIERLLAVTTPYASSAHALEEIRASHNV
ncbi:protein kinase family protein [Paenibacillus lemnae]|uniref:Protein kinase family protein n=1 Tax=Paenibacillus lemnae TaxID=1330551 RepID=A0A848MAU9_PAELE|nr:protein kinase family protein [Paenibacillus lemnae]NMO97666.1 protein kinase family protein [Paenibacillus lemnae]